MKNELRKFIGSTFGVLTWLFVGLFASYFVSPGAAVFIGLLAGWGVAVLIYPKN
jgi:hypothetical protein